VWSPPISSFSTIIMVCCLIRTGRTVRESPNFQAIKLNESLNAVHRTIENAEQAVEE
jgi:hypothetical protein